MYAAQIFNEKHKKEIPAVFGCVTDGTNWRFLKLEQKNAYIDTQIYHIEHDLAHLLEILVKIARA